VQSQTRGPTSPHPPILGPSAQHDRQETPGAPGSSRQKQAGCPAGHGPSQAATMLAATDVGVTTGSNPSNPNAVSSQHPRDGALPFRRPKPQSQSESVPGVSTTVHPPLSIGQWRCILLRTWHPVLHPSLPACFAPSKLEPSRGPISSAFDGPQCVKARLRRREKTLALVSV